MENSKDSNESHNSGAGQAVNVVITSGSVKWIIVAILALIVMLFLTDHTSVGAELKANQAMKSAEDRQTDLAMIQFWAMRVKASCDAKGVSVPDLPANFRD